MKQIAIYTAISMAVVMTLLLWNILRRIRVEGFIRQLRDGINGHDYGGLTRRLVKSGIADKMTPPVYRLVQGMLFLIGFAVMAGISCGWMICLLCGVGCVAVPDICIRIHIKKENRRMLQDIEHLYHLMHLQHQAGAYVIDSLIDSYRVVTYWRLKKALVDLTGAIGNKMTVREATDTFAGKFDNPYITTLADIIRHSVEDGNTDTMLADVSEQLSGIRQAQYVMEEGKQELAGVIISTLLFVGIIAGIFIIGFGAFMTGGEILLF